MHFLIRFAQVREDFRLEELKSICSYFEIPFPDNDVLNYSNECPFWIATFPDEESVKKILSRSILIKGIVELLGEGSTLEECIEKVKQIRNSYFSPYETDSFCFEVDDYMGKIEHSQQVALINKFSFLPLKGPVSIKNAKVIFSIHCDAITGKYYMGRWLGEGRRDLITLFNLKKRVYLGTTSMDAELSLVMSNLARVGPSSLVYDPFVGTGSLLCTSSAFGALSLGSDIDGRQMRGSKCDEKSIHANMRQYGVEARFVGGIVCDILHNPWRREGFKVDAIITDPPYGVRAGAKKIGIKYEPNMKPLAVSSLSKEEKAQRYPMTVPYEMNELAVDLHRMATEWLRVGGRLVYWYPVEIYDEEGRLRSDRKRLDEDQLRQLIPSQDEKLALIAAIPQQCRMFDRWLLVYERI